MRLIHATAMMCMFLCLSVHAAQAPQAPPAGQPFTQDDLLQRLDRLRDLPPGLRVEFEEEEQSEWAGASFASTQSRYEGFFASDGKRLVSDQFRENEILFAEEKSATKKRTSRTRTLFHALYHGEPAEWRFLYPNADGSSGLSISISPDPEKDFFEGTLPVGKLLGYVESRPLSVTLRESENWNSTSAEADEPEGTLRLEAQIPAGKYTIWVDPSSAFFLRRIRILRQPEDLISEKETLSDRARLYYLCNLTKTPTKSQSPSHNAPLDMLTPEQIRSIPACLNQEINIEYHNLVEIGGHGSALPSLVRMEDVTHYAGGVDHVTICQTVFKEPRIVPLVEISSLMNFHDVLTNGAGILVLEPPQEKSFFAHIRETYTWQDGKMVP